MLTDERLKQLDGIASQPHVPKYDLRNSVNEVVHAYRTLQQQNKQMRETLETSKEIYVDSVSYQDAALKMIACIAGTLQSLQDKT